MIRSDATGSVACPVATRVEPFGVVDDLWSSRRTTCVAAKGDVRCGELYTWGFNPTPTSLDARRAFQWDGLPCAVTRDAKIRCSRDDKTKEVATLAPVEHVATDGSSLCVLLQGVVRCRRNGATVDLAKDVAALAAGDWTWVIRKNGELARVGLCSNGSSYAPCSFAVRSSIRDPIAIASLGPQACVLARDGRVACTECSAKGPCTDKFEDVRSIADATQLAVAGHACVVRKTGEVVCWGGSSCGEAGGAVEGGKVCSEKPIVVPPTTIVWAK